METVTDDAAVLAYNMSIASTYKTVVWSVYGAVVARWVVSA